MAEIQPTDTPTADPIADAISFLESAADIPAEAATDEGAEASGIGTSPSEPTGEVAQVDVPAKAVEPPKPEEKLSPAMETLAKRDRAIQERQAALKAERDALEAERTKWQSERAAVEQVELLAKTDLVGLAERVKLDPQARMKLAIELWNSAQPSEKQTPEYREAAKTRTALTATEERLARLEAETKAAQQRAQQAEQQAQTVQLGETIVSSVGAALPSLAERAPYVAALLETDRAGVREDLLALAQQHWETDPDTDLTPAMLIERYEPLLAAKFEPLKRVLERAQRPKTQSLPEAEKKPSSTLSAQRTAAPTKARPEPKSEEDLIRDAAAFLESRQ